MINGHVATHRVYIAGIEIPLSDSLDVVRHSPTHFGWGHAGAGPAQLALAILLLFLKPKQAKMYYQRFKVDVIARLRGRGDFSLPVQAVRQWIKQNVAGNRIDEEVTGAPVTLHIA